MSLTAILSVCLATAGDPPIAPTRDRLVPIDRFQASADESTPAASITIDGASGGTAWRNASAEFTLGGPIEAGAWILSAGSAGIDVAARLNSHALEMVTTPSMTDPALATGPRFLVPAEFLVEGAHRLDLEFRGTRRGRGFERGPVWLCSPTSGERLESAATASDLTLSVGNYATLGSTTRGGSLLDRVLFKYGEAGATLAAQLDFAVSDGSHGEEVEARQFQERKLTDWFPSAALQFADRRLTAFKGQLTAHSPLLTSPLVFADAKALEFGVNQTGAREAFNADWRIRFFPTVGGRLRTVRGDGFLLICNDCVGLFAEDGRVLGSDEEPAGIAFSLVKAEKAGHLQSLAGVTMRCGVVGFERGAADPSQADSIEDLVGEILAAGESESKCRAAFGSAIAQEPGQGSVALGGASRRSVLATLAGSRRRGRTFVFAPPAGAQSPEAFFADTFSLLHFPVHERLAIEWLLATQRDDGAISGDLDAAASELDRMVADCYAVLRACRWYRWTYDGDRFLSLTSQLARALDHADRLESLTISDSNGGTTTSPLPLHVELARIAAHRELAAALSQLGGDAERIDRSTRAATTQLDRLLAPPTEGGRLADGQFIELPGEDPREQAVALVFGLVDEGRTAALATRLAQLPPSAELNDWRDVLVIEGALMAGRTKAVAGRFDDLLTATRDDNAIENSAVAAFHGALLFGRLGVHRPDFGTIEVAPRLIDREFVRTRVRLPEGSVNLQVLPPNAQGARQLIVANESSLDLVISIATPGGAGVGAIVRVGDIALTWHEHLVEHGTTWRETVH